MRLKSIDSEYSWPFASSFPRYAMQIVGGDRICQPGDSNGSAYASRSWNSRLRSHLAHEPILLNYLQIDGAYLVEGAADELVTESPAANREGRFEVIDNLATPGAVIQSFSSAVAAECFSDAGLRDRRTRRRGDNKKAAQLVSGFLRPSKFFVAIEFQSTHPVANSHDRDRAHASDNSRPLSNASHPT